MKRLLSVLLLTSMILTGCNKADQAKKKVEEKTEQVEQADFALLTGMKSSELKKIKKHYDDLIIKNSVSKKDMKVIRTKADVVYAPLNISKTTKSSSYPHLFTYEGITYANITKSKWTKHLKKEITSLQDKGYSGLYLSGLDIFEYAKNTDKEKIYNAIYSLLEYIDGKDMKVIACDGDDFMSQFMRRQSEKANLETVEEQADSKEAREEAEEVESDEEEKDISLIKGILKENVFTLYDEKDPRKGQTKEASDELKSYLGDIKEYGMEVYVIEYTKSSDWKAVIEAYCKRHGFHYDIVKSHNLDKESI